MSVLENLKEKYNKVLARELAAEKFFKTATEEEVEKWLPKLTEIIVELSKMMKEYETLTGKEMSKEEVFGGFNVSS